MLAFVPLPFTIPLRWSCSSHLRSRPFTAPFLIKTKSISKIPSRNQTGVVKASTAATSSSPSSSFPQSASSSTTTTPSYDDNLTGGRYHPSKWGQGLWIDCQRRFAYYKSDFTDIAKAPGKTLSAILFLFFACIAPVTAFGALTALLTKGAINVSHYILSCSTAGILYGLLSGQPMTFLGPTGLNTAFIAAVFTYCLRVAQPFKVLYAWIGVWTGLILMLIALVNLSDLAKRCTMFTEDIFNFIIMSTFLYEALRSIKVGFYNGITDKTKPLLSAALALSTYVLANAFSSAKNSPYFNAPIRNFLKDFGPTLTIIGMSCVAALPLIKQFSLECISVASPSTGVGAVTASSLASTIGSPATWIIPFFSVPTSVILTALPPAMLLVCLLFLDQMITVRCVNSKQHYLTKPVGYHLDVFALGVCTLIPSLFAWPWVVAGTVQSLNHVKFMQLEEQVVAKSQDDTAIDPFISSSSTSSPVITLKRSTLETRFVPIAVHVMIGASLFLLPLLSQVPVAVISGLFLFLGKNMSTSIDIIKRLNYLIMDPLFYPQNSPMKILHAREVHLFTFIQLLCVAAMWIIKMNEATSIYFPIVIALLLFIREFIVAKLLSKRALQMLDSEPP